MPVLLAAARVLVSVDNNHATFQARMLPAPTCESCLLCQLSNFHQATCIAQCDFRIQPPDTKTALANLPCTCPASVPMVLQVLMPKNKNIYGMRSCDAFLRACCSGVNVEPSYVKYLLRAAAACVINIAVPPAVGCNPTFSQSQHMTLQDFFSVLIARSAQCTCLPIGVTLTDTAP